MAVIVKYIVVRNGEEKMTFATKKEADAYDKMLDIADRLFDFLDSADVNLDEDQQDAISLLMAEKRDELMPILRGIKPKKKPAPEKAGSAKPAAPAKKAAARKPVKAPAKNPAKAVKPKVAAKKK
ncbi:MAG: YebG family protein [Desulfobacterales bacterium]|nr:YebG family protein [Desulfobacterales bacterium]